MIKFRAWDKEHKRMLKIETLALGFSHKGVLTCIYSFGPDYSNDPDIIGDDEPDLDSVILEQFTGLKDKQGVEIYEGDILHFGSVWCVGDECDPREEEHIGAVEYHQDYASYVVNCNGKIFPLEQVISFDGYSVQGNVHENPELLKG